MRAPNFFYQSRVEVCRLRFSSKQYTFQFCLFFLKIFKLKMSTQLEILRSVVKRCVGFAALKGVSGVLSLVSEEASECELVSWLTTFINDLDMIEIATLYKLCLNESDTAVLIAGDIAVNHGGSTKDYLAELMSRYFSLRMYIIFTIVSCILNIEINFILFSI